MMRHVIRVFFVCTALAALISCSVRYAEADVVATGAVQPLPDLNTTYQFGGDVGSTKIVIGYNDTANGIDTGVLVMDIPQDTDPLESDDGSIGQDPFSLGLVTLTGLNTVLRFRDGFMVGEEGQGTLEVLSGAQAVVVYGGNPSSSSGTDPDATLTLGLVEGAQGFANIDGFASSLVSQSVDVGFEGYGRIDLLNRGRVGTNETARLGVAVTGDGYVLVSGQGSRWNIGDGPSSDGFPGDDALANLEVGVDGRGIVEMLEQGVIRVERNATLGVNAGSYGEASVSGQSSQFWVLQNLFVGGIGDGVLSVADHGLVRVDGIMTINPTSFVNLAGGTVRNYDASGAARTILNTGVIRGDGRIEANINNAVGELRAASTIDLVREKLLVTGAVVGGVLEAYGGEIEIQGPLTGAPDIRLKNGILRANGGFTAGGLVDITLSSDPAAIFVSGGANLGGDLTVKFGSGFNPPTDQSFTLIYGDTISGTFANEFVPAGWQVTYLATSVVLNSLASPVFLEADFNMDRIVDANDLAIWKANYGAMPATNAIGDANNDGKVDGADFIIYQRQLGMTTATPVVAAVPEPGSLALAATALAGLGWLRRRAG